jgi:6-pyruvoyltetrahydropterin/6-carboxytetrahydropterin synthase
VIVTRRFRFSAGHRLFGHEGKCLHPHGHNYEAAITVEAQAGLDPLGRVIDFAVLKEAVGGWIDENWDHAFIVFDGDAEMMAIYAEHPEWRKYVMDRNPTAENMAQVLFLAAYDRLKRHRVRVRRVRLWETSDCYADAV